MSHEKPQFNAHEAPPQELKDLFKKYQRSSPSELEKDEALIDFGRGAPHLDATSCIPGEELSSMFSRFTGESCTVTDQTIYGHDCLPGLLVLPSLIPVQVQKVMLSRLIHRDLSDPRHRSNVHLHYNVPYPDASSSSPHETQLSYFSYSQSNSNLKFEPKDPTVHKPLSLSRFLNKSLRWITLGGQYDWTNKVYPDEKPPDFPPDIAGLIERLFPDMKAQAGIVNFYSPGDTLSLHRDVSEEVDRPLLSLSIGCDCIFIIGLGQEASDRLVLRLRSGDAVCMSKSARFAWHGVAKILPHTCPSALEDWPAEEGLYEDWRGWMSSKRVNLNVRQMYAD